MGIGTVSPIRRSCGYPSGIQVQPGAAV